jgi:hypothetical protein
MPRRPSGRSRQPDLFPRSKRPAIQLPDNHPIVVLTDTVDWTEMEVRADKIREKKLKNAAGRPPQLRALLGALTLMAIRNRPYRELEDQIRYYAPARYLCGLTETDWDAGLHHGARFRAADGRGRRAADQRKRGRAGGGVGAGRHQGCSCGHDGTGGGDPASQRDGATGRLRPIGRIGGAQGPDRPSRAS